MKVLIVSPGFPPEVGAARSRIYNLAEGLNQHGIVCDVLTTLPNYPKGEIFDGYKHCFSKHEVINGIQAYRYWCYASPNNGTISRMLNMLSSAVTIWAFGTKRSTIKQYDIVIIQTPGLPMASSALMMLKKIYGKRSILNVSDIWPSTAVELGAMREGSLPWKVMTKMEKFLYKNSDIHQGQSKEILRHMEGFGYNKPTYLYRNLQHTSEADKTNISRKPFKIVYAGLLGVAQNLLGVVKNVDFKALGAELHLYGSGAQVQEIEETITQNDLPIFYHGSIPKAELLKILPTFNASIVPLTVRIHGAVPSKIFDLMPMGVPILFSGGGEGAEIIDEYKLGFNSEPGDFMALEANIKKLIEMSDEEYDALRGNCINAAQTDFSFDVQIEDYIRFLNSL